MKRLLALLLAAILVLSLAACGSKEPTKKDDEDDKENAEVQDDAPSFTFSKFGKVKVILRGAEFAKDDDDEDFLRVYIDYVNLDKTAAGHSRGSVLEMEITQNGEELDDDQFSTFDDCSIPEDMNYDRQVQPGIPLRNTILIYCSPEDGPVDIAMTAMVGSWMYNEEDLEWFKFQLDPEDLPEAPKPFEIKPIADPTYAKDLPTSGTSTSGGNPFTVSLNGYELTSYDGEPALRVKMTYTHQDDWDMSPYTALPIYVYQDGISLDQVDTWYLDDEVTAEDEAFETDVTKGDTVDCNAIFLLRGDSPAEVVIEQTLDDLRVGMTCNVK